MQVSCYTTARIDRLLFSEAEQEAAGPGQLEAASLTADSARGLDQFGGCLSSLTRCVGGDSDQSELKMFSVCKHPCIYCLNLPNFALICLILP